ncbi:hypothetical protein BGZ83_010670 [Gryganskiella cystojenkinii]|nr:hypothetical protein BGZ83_010670 [Gryganskiella cystojenkinii]
MSLFPPKDVSPLLSAAYDVFPDPASLVFEEINGDSRVIEEGVGAEDFNPHHNEHSGAISSSASSLDARTPTTVDYLSFLCVFNFERVIFHPCYEKRRIEVNRDWTEYPPRLANYIFKTETDTIADRRGEGLHDNDLMLPNLTGDGNVDTLARVFRYGALATTLRRDLTWTFCQPILEQIQRLSIPLSDIDRYIDSVQRFRSLRSVYFVPDEYQNRALEYDSQRRARLEQTLLVFVKRHTILFPGLLRFASCSSCATWFCLFTCTRDTQLELKRLLPPIQKLRTIDEANQDHVQTKIKETDLSAVRSITLLGQYRYRQDNPIRDIIQADPSFLSRCRSLKYVKVKGLDLGLFQWAVEEKKSWDRYHASTAASSIPVPLSADAAVPSPLPLVPLERLHLLRSHTSGPKLNQFAYAFSESLTTVDFTIDFENDTDGYDATEVDEGEDGVDGTNGPPAPELDHHHWRLGQGWRLPKLQILSIRAGSVRHIEIDRLLLSNGGLSCWDSLEKLALFDDTPLYQCSVIRSCRPAAKAMPRLKEINLKGWPALTFHPDTLHQTPNLEELNIGTHHDMWTPPREESLESFQPLNQDEYDRDSEHIYTDQEHEQGQESEMATTSVSTPVQLFDGGLRYRRAPWTWDWYLPLLKNLHLTSEFAILFEFRMLERCPSLQVLWLQTILDKNALRMDEPPMIIAQRVLTLRDFLIDGTSSSSLSDYREPRLVKSSVTHLHLIGYWSLDDNLRKIVFKASFPKMTHMIEQRTMGYTLEGWISGLEDHPTLQEVHLTMQGRDTKKTFRAVDNNAEYGQAQGDHDGGQGKDEDEKMSPLRSAEKRILAAHGLTPGMHEEGPRVPMSPAVIDKQKAPRFRLVCKPGPIFYINGQSWGKLSANGKTLVWEGDVEDEDIKDI